MDKARKILEELKAEQRVARKTLNAYNEKLEIEQQKVVEIEGVQSLFQSAVAMLYENLSTKLGSIITEGINIVFPDAQLELIIHFEERRNTVEADIMLIDSDGEEFTVLDDSGGGLGDFIAILLRITYITLSKYDNILIADEPLKFVDRDRIPEAAAFIRKVCEDFKFQLIMVSHIPEMAAESEIVYKITKAKGVSTAKRVDT
jgi:ABC-type dipeptide/oligopeptide/nickel transport system ATPase subunit